MRCRWSIAFALWLATFAAPESASAQLTISGPIGEQASPTVGTIRQVSLAARQQQVTAGLAASPGTQIRVSVHYLQVDDATREAIYQALPAGQAKHFVDIPSPGPQVPLSHSDVPNHCSRNIQSPSRVTSCVLPAATSDQILAAVQQSSSSTIARSPSIILLEGQEAELNDVSQRPVVVDVQQTAAGPEPVVHVLDEGTRVRMLATLNGPANDNGQPLLMAAEVATSTVLNLRAEQIFDDAGQPLTVQVPTFQVQTATINEALVTGESLLVDLHVQQSRTVQSETSTPIFNKIPYINRSFTNIKSVTVTEHLLVMLQPTIER